MALMLKFALNLITRKTGTLNDLFKKKKIMVERANY